MTYLLIAFVLAIILSPLMWFRQSPRQKLITAMRQKAAAKGLRVKLSKPADAREGEGRLEYVTYTLPWKPGSDPSEKPRMEKWLLLKETHRGDPSPWPEWQWMGRESNDSLVSCIGSVLEKLPKTVAALEASPEGIRIYWQERGALNDIGVVGDQLSVLRDTIRN
jgi:FPC/CPF motif-containing protein YcgG